MFELEIVTPDGIIQPRVPVQYVTFPGHRGQLTALEGHHSLVTLLGLGPCEFLVKNGHDPNHLFVAFGYAQVEPNGVTLLAQQVWKPSDLKLDELLEKLKQLEQQSLQDWIPDEAFEDWNKQLSLVRSQIQWLMQVQKVG